MGRTMTGPFGDDDVANNIWQEQQRDAAPSPEEVVREQEKRLEEGECENCGEEDNLDYYIVNEYHQQDVYILCEECGEEYNES